MALIVVGGSVAFEEFTDSTLGGPSPVYSGSRESFSSRRIGKIPWSSVASAISEMFPASPSLPGTHPASAFLYCESFDVKPLSGSGATCTSNTTAYDHAILTVNYKTLEYDPSDLLTRRASLSSEMLEMPESGFKWEDGDPVDNEDLSPGKIVPSVDHIITLHRQTSVSWSDIASNIGHVNSGGVSQIRSGIAAEQLMFIGAEINWSVKTDGTTEFSLDYRFRERLLYDAGGTARGWNHFYRPGEKAWERLVDDNGDPVYPLSANFGNLF